MKSMRTHDWIDQRSLALARAVAVKIKDNPELFAIAADNLRRWKQTLQPWPAALREWEEIIAQGPEHALACLVEDSERGRRRRQSHPFPGVLTPAERNSIFRHYETLRA